MNDLTAFQRDTLYIIAGLDGSHGRAIKDELEDYYEKEVYHGRLYPNLDRLIEMDIVNKNQYNGRTNTYTVTDQGRQELDTRHKWEAQYLTGEALSSH